MPCYSSRPQASTKHSLTAGEVPFKEEATGVVSPVHATEAVGQLLYTRSWTGLGLV